MRKLLVLLALGLLALAASCETLNVGSGGPQRGPAGINVTVPTAALGLGQGTFQVSWTGGTGPYTVQYTFSGCVSPLVHTRTANGFTDSLTVDFLDPGASAANCTVTVRVTDSQGQFADSAATPFTVGIVPNQAPVIVSAVANNAAGTVEVTVSDADGDDVTVTATPPAGVSVANATQTVAGGNGSVTFSFSADDVFAGGGGAISFVANDGTVDSAPATATLTFAPFPLADDTIYAIPSSGATSTGTPLRIIVATGATANPFQYQNNVRVTFPTACGPAYVADSFNVGLPGGARDAIDGLWATMAPSGFLLGPDSFITAIDLGDGRTAFDFNVTPLGGSDIQAAGALFNFEMTFATAGPCEIGFQRQSADLISRTYYQDASQTTDFFWGTDTNAGGHNTVAVN